MVSTKYCVRIQKHPSSPEVNFNLGVIAKHENEDFAGYFNSFLKSSASQTVFTDFASQFVDGWKPGGSETQIEFSYDCEKAGITLGASKEDILDVLGEPDKEITILAYEDVMLWPYPDHSLKIYFMEKTFHFLLKLLLNILF